jgi:hypothetical protein
MKTGDSTMVNLLSPWHLYAPIVKYHKYQVIFGVIIEIVCQDYVTCFCLIFHWHCTVQMLMFLCSVVMLFMHIVDCFFLFLQTTPRRVADRKIARFEKNITKRGAVPETVKKGDDYPLGPILLGFFIFVIVGSCKFLCLTFIVA